MRDGSGNNKWLSGSLDASTGCYGWTNGNLPYSLPLDFKIKANGNVIRKDNIINAWTEDAEGDLENNFAISADELQSDGFETEGEDADDALDAKLVAVIVICCVLLIAAGFLVLLFVRRKRKKAAKDGLEDHANNANVELPINNNTQSNIMAVEEDGDEST